MTRNRIISRERAPDPVPQIHELTRLWLESFQLCVNTKDYEMARGMFSPGVVGFGTVAYSTNNLDELVSEQWEKRWPLNESFEFDIQSAKLIPCRPYIMVALPWSARDVDGAERKGRATLMLLGKKEPDGPIELMCCHSHFSVLNPHD